MEPRPDKKTAKRLAAPYARAAFDVARDEAELDDWELKLEQLAKLFKEPDLKDMPHDPRLNAAKLKYIMGKVMDELEASPSQRRLIDLLIKDKKLSLLPWVHKGFVAERRKAENAAMMHAEPLADATIISAKELTAQQLDNLKATLKKRFNVASEPEVKIDPALIGGLKIIIGSRVYDQSIQGQLERMRKHLKEPPKP